MDKNFEDDNQLDIKIKKMEVTPMKIICSILTIITYMIDVVLDVIVAVKHFNDGNVLFGILTVCFIVVPAITMTGFSMWWYKSDSYEVSVKQWILRIIFHILCMAPVIRNLEALYYAWKSYRSKRAEEKESYSRRMIYENTDASLLRLFEAFLECGSQLVLQTYIFAITQSIHPNVYTSTGTCQLISIASSLLSMASALTAYHRSLRESLDDKNELTCSVALLPTSARFFELASRIIALGLFASVFPHYIFLVLIIHAGISFIYIRTLRTEFCDNQFGEIIYNLIVAAMWMFLFFNPKDSPTQLRCIFFYIFMEFENCALMALWFPNYSPLVEFKLFALILHFGFFTLGVSIMFIYYIQFHPTVGRTAKRKHRPAVQMQKETSRTSSSIEEDHE